MPTSGASIYFLSVKPEEMKTARLRRADGQVEQKQFVGAPKRSLSSYRKGDHGNIVGRIYFEIDPGQDLKSDSITYTEVAGPKPQ